jgi:hypothetical protein
MRIERTTAILDIVTLLLPGIPGNVQKTENLTPHQTRMNRVLTYMFVSFHTRSVWEPGLISLLSGSTAANSLQASPLNFNIGGIKCPII